MTCGHNALRVSGQSGMPGVLRWKCAMPGCGYGELRPIVRGDQPFPITGPSPEPSRAERIEAEYLAAGDPPPPCWCGRTHE
jgi:hypothetical protein